MDSLQAEILRYRLSKLDQVIKARRSNAERYRQQLSGCPVTLPVCQPHQFNTFHLFAIQCSHRDALQKHLADQGIATGIHYPTPIHLQPAARALNYQPGSLPVAERQAGRILSLPVHQFLAESDIDRVAAEIRSFFKAL
jgi:dTDP-4-amino-4,6-dideoxygalactose transaminase